MIYEQMISIYGTVIVNARNKKDAEDKINNILWNLQDKHNHLIEEGLIIGEIDRFSAIKKCKGGKYV